MLVGYQAYLDKLTFLAFNKFKIAELVLSINNPQLSNCNLLIHRYILFSTLLI